MTSSRTVWEVCAREYSPTSIPPRLFTDRDEAELFRQRAQEIYGFYADLTIRERQLNATAPEAEVWYVLVAWRDSEGRIDSWGNTPTRSIFWSDEEDRPPNEATCQPGPEDRTLKAIAPTAEEARRLLNRELERWRSEAAEKANAERLRMMSNFLGAAGPIMNGEL